MDEVANAALPSVDSVVVDATDVRDANKKDVLKPKGLMNLGNTCYANSVLQVLSQTQLLRERLTERVTRRKAWKAVNESHLKRLLHNLFVKNHEDDEEKDSNGAITRVDANENCDIDVILPDPYKLTVFVAELLCEMNASNRCIVISPPSVINATSAKYSQFKGRDQQDSHEFLRCILDVIRTDEIRRQRKAILDGLNIEIKKNHSYDDDTKALVKSYGHASNFTVIDEIFGGFLLCSVKCEECESTSQHFEPFFDLSLPVSEEKHKHKTPRKGKEKEEEEENNSLQLAADVSNLSLKDRRSRRQQKKAAKREVRLQKKKNKCQKSDAKEEEEEAKEQEGNVKVDVNVTVVNGNVDVDVNVGVDGNDELNCNVHVNCKSLKANANVDNRSDVVDLETSDHNCVSSDINNEDNVQKKEDLIATINGEEDADDEGISEEDKSVNVITSELESVDLNKGDICESFQRSEVGNKQRIRTTSVNLEEREYREKVKWSLTTLSPRNVEPGVTSLLSCLASFTAPELLVGANKLICDNCGEKFQKRTGVEKKVYSNASKHMTIAFPPPVLTLHLKRFEAEGYHSVNLRKITRTVNFPLHFDLSPFVSNIYEPLCRLLGNGNIFSRKVNYSLFGVVEHSGSLRSGHYTAYVKVRPKSETLKRFVRVVPFGVKVEELLEKLDFCPLLTSETDDHNDEVIDSGHWFHVSDTEVNATSVERVLHSQAYILFYERV